MRKLMALILSVFGRDRRHGSGYYPEGRRSTDRHQVAARVDAVERRLAAYGRVKFPK